MESLDVLGVDGATNRKVLSVDDWKNISESLTWFENWIELYYGGFEAAIQSFSTNPIVQSFYKSGKFGKQKEDELIALKEGLKEYTDMIASDDDSLIPKTRKIIDDQISALNNPKI